MPEEMPRSPVEAARSPTEVDPTEPSTAKEQKLIQEKLQRLVYAKAMHHLFNLLKEEGESPVELLDVSYNSQEEELPSSSIDLEQIIGWLQSKQLANLQPELIKRTKQSLSDLELPGQEALIEQIFQQFSEND